jgi:hypothetical protein
MFSRKAVVPKQEDPGLLQRARAARRALNSNAPENVRKLNAAMALLAPSRINQITGLLKGTLSKNNYITNLSRVNIFANTLKKSLPTYPGGAIVTRSQVRDAAIMAMSSYIAQKIGFVNSANTQRMNDLLIRLIKLKAAVENQRGNLATRQQYGAEIGRILGQLVMVWTQLERKRLPNGRARNIGKGALRGFLNTTVGSALSGTVMMTINSVEGVQKFTGQLRF